VHSPEEWAHGPSPQFKTQVHLCLTERLNLHVWFFLKKKRHVINLYFLKLNNNVLSFLIDDVSSIYNIF